LRKLTIAGRNIEPNWSPNGKKIVYAHQPGVGPNRLADLWIMNANGTDKRAFIKTKHWESEPDWGTASPTS
jgi:Tol biopolymer transport system component